MEIDKTLSRSGFRIFSDREFREITGVSPVSAKFLLIRYTQRGLLCRLKRGLYAGKTRMPSSWAIANRLYKPSYVSLSSALSYYGLIPENVYTVTSVTTKSTREFDVQDISYAYRTIKRHAFAGYRTVEIAGESVLIAEREKALADYLYLVFLKKEPWNERLNLAKVDRQTLKKYLKAFGRSGMVKWFENDIKIADRRTAR